MEQLEQLRIASLVVRILEEDAKKDDTTTSSSQEPPLISKSHILSAVLGGLFVVILIAIVRYLKEKILTSRHERAVREIERNYHAVRRARYNSSMDIQRRTHGGITAGVNRFLRSMELQEREFAEDRIKFVRQYLDIWVWKDSDDEELGRGGGDEGKDDSLTSLRNKNREEVESRETELSMMDDMKEKKDENDCTKESLDPIQLHSSACSICYERYKVGDELAKPKIQQCSSHVFHASCLESWLMKHVNCPLCRHVILIDEDTV
ncbi:hypothetical protein CTEN210_00884 [Chaetoceros tenuissimus]|uniref:RING-type domain-containing protein n=1 Tax=Chaetoceros tenuissimus TaxID=426638 RepID=A0AAD3CG00_9STRA|nr:hypothetical protein CTEN210_00884 [Chaetoceros tenuissimus]